MAVAYTMVDTLKKAGRNLTRASVLRRDATSDETNPFLLPGVQIKNLAERLLPDGQGQAGALPRDALAVLREFVSAAVNQRALSGE
jgi:hypothetical protein